MAASWTFGGVSKSGSPTDRLIMSRPPAFSSVASAVIAIVGDGFTRARRSARNDITNQHPKRQGKHPNIRGLSCEPHCRLEGSPQAHWGRPRPAAEMLQARM